MKMKFKEFTFNGKNIFDYIETIQGFPFPKELVPASEMFNAFVLLNGEREVFSNLAERFEVDPETTLDQIARVIKLFNSKKWELLYNLMDLDFSANSIETVNEQVSNDGNNLNKVSSFDSDVLTDDTNEVKTNKSNRTYERSTKSVSQSIENLTKLQDNLIYGTIFKDIRETVLKNII